MIRRLIQKFFIRTVSHKKKCGPVIIPLKMHGLRRNVLSVGAERVCNDLYQAGYKAFVVGGAVRDLLLGRNPKDFDIATNATPEEVRRCCKRARIIGRRFRIVHVMVGRELVEVTTFRTSQNDVSATDEYGRILRDNTFGSQSQDADRRDFTVNALYYDPSNETIYDYHHGYADLKSGKLSIIGDPLVRYREDPVRMLRAIRLEARLGLDIDRASRDPICVMAPLLDNVPPARLFDEILKLLTCGDSLTCLKKVLAEGLHHGIFPLLGTVLDKQRSSFFIEQVLTDTDKRIHTGKSVSPSFLFAALLWHEVLLHWKERKARGEVDSQALFSAMSDVLQCQSQKLAITKRLVVGIKEIWSLQPRFEQTKGRRPYRLLNCPAFRAGYDFMLLRAQAGEIDQNLPNWWTRFIALDSEAREALTIHPPKKSALKKYRRYKK